MKTCVRNVLASAMAVALMAGQARAGEIAVPVNGITGSHGGDTYANGMISLINGSGITKGDPSDPSTWTFNGSNYGDEWMASSLVVGTVITPGLNGKCAWASFDLGASRALFKLWIFNNNYQSGQSGVKQYNLYYAVSPSVGLPAQPAKATYAITGLTPQADYDFSSAGWTKFNTSGVLTAPQTAITSVDLSGVNARYVAVEILSNYGETYSNNRVGFDEIAFTIVVSDMNWIGGTGNWSDDTKWDPGLYTDRDVKINVAGSAVTVDAAASGAKVTVGKDNTASLVIPDDKTLSVSEIGSLGIGAAGTLTVDGTLSAPALNNLGTVFINSTSDMTGVGSVGLSAGTLTLGKDNALGRSTLSFTGGAISSDSTTARTITNTVTLSGNAGFGDTVKTGKLIFSGPVALKVNSTLTLPSDAQIGGVISGAFNLTKTGIGTLTLSGINTYTGSTTVNAGNLIVGVNAPSNANGALGNATSEVILGVAGGNTDAGIIIGGAYTVARIIRNATANTTDTGTRVLTLGGNTAHNATFSGNIFLGTSAQTSKGLTLAAVAGGQVNFSGIIQETGGARTQAETNSAVALNAITKIGAGIVVLANTNSYFGKTVVSEGILDVRVASSLGTGSGIRIDYDIATLRLENADNGGSPWDLTALLALEPNVTAGTNGPTTALRFDLYGVYTDITASSAPIGTMIIFR